jgi:phage gp36-like protein
MIYLLFAILIIPLCAIAVWFVLANKASDERYEREIERIYGRKR